MSTLGLLTISSTLDPINTTLQGLHFGLFKNFRNLHAGEGRRPKELNKGEKVKIEAPSVWALANAPFSFMKFSTRNILTLDDDPLCILSLYARRSADRICSINLCEQLVCL